MKLKAPQRRARHRGRWIAAIVTAGVVVGIGTYWVWPRSAPMPGGTPRLTVDRTTIDFGDVPFDRFVDARFTLANAGDGVLTIAGRPPVTATQGC